MNRVALNTAELVSVLVRQTASPFGICWGVRPDRLYGRFSFSSLRTLQTGFHNNSTNLRSYQQRMRDPVSLPHMLSVVSLILVILMGKMKSKSSFNLHF